LTDQDFLPVSAVQTMLTVLTQKLGRAGFYMYGGTLSGQRKRN
jgi:hypothetical protein